MKPERDEISTIIETEAAAAINEAFQKKNTDAKQLLAMFITVISMVVGIVLWATNSHAEIKDWTANQDFVTKSELTQVIKEQYVKKEDFAVLREKLENLNKNHEKVIEALEKMNSKLDDINESRNNRVRTR